MLFDRDNTFLLSAIIPKVKYTYLSHKELKYFEIIDISYTISDF